MKDKRSFKERGITLIALVITIVVLLILAGVTINAVFSDSGIIKKAQQAQNKANESVQKDMEQINAVENWMNSYTNTTEPTKPNIGDSIGTIDIPQASTDKGNVKISTVKEDMYDIDLQRIVEKLNGAPRASTVKTAFGEDLPASVNLYGQEGIKKKHIDLDDYKFLSPVLDIKIDEATATEDNQVKITFVANNMTDNMTIDIFYYCPEHGWEVIEGEKISGNQVEGYLHSSSSNPGIPGALIYKLSN